MTHISNDLKIIIKNLGLYENFRLELIKNDFKTIFPSPLCEHISPSFLKKSQLLIAVDSHEWLNEIGCHKDKIEGRLSGYGVKSVRFKLGRVFRKKNPPPVKISSVKIPDDVMEVVTNSIKDGEVRKALLKAVRASYKRERNIKSFRSSYL